MTVKLSGDPAQAEALRPYPAPMIDAMKRAWVAKEQQSVASPGGDDQRVQDIISSLKVGGRWRRTGVAAAGGRGAAGAGGGVVLAAAGEWLERGPGIAPQRGDGWRGLADCWADAWDGLAWHEVWATGGVAAAYRSQ